MALDLANLGVAFRQTEIDAASVSNVMGRREHLTYRGDRFLGRWRSQVVRDALRELSTMNESALEWCLVVPEEPKVVRWALLEEMTDWSLCNVLGEIDGEGLVLGD